LPTRLFHWSIVLSLPLAWWSAANQRYEMHQWTGCTVLALVVSRVAWGFLGSRHSRFSDFLVGPRRVLAYLRGVPAEDDGVASS
jgi:cytochrome b